MLDFFSMSKAILTVLRDDYLNLRQTGSAGRSSETPLYKFTSKSAPATEHGA